MVAIITGRSPSYTRRLQRARTVGERPLGAASVNLQPLSGNPQTSPWES